MLDHFQDDEYEHPCRKLGKHIAVGALDDGLKFSTVLCANTAAKTQ